MEETDAEAFVDGPVSSPDAARPFNDLGILQDHDCDFRDSNTAINATRPIGKYFICYSCWTFLLMLGPFRSHCFRMGPDISY